jgi:hypothetical protein
VFIRDASSAAASGAARTSAYKPLSSSTAGETLPRCWKTQYAMSPARMWRSNHGSAFISSSQPCEIRHSAWISWSSKIIVTGTVDMSQRIPGSDHASP